MVSVGHLENGVKCGHGKMQLPTGVSYEGEWKDNMQCGEGEMKWPDGGVYTGDFLNDLRHGKGTQKFPNGEVGIVGYLRSLIKELYRTLKLCTDDGLICLNSNCSLPMTCKIAH